MGSWIGHIDEGIFFIVLSLWWCYKIFTGLIEVGCHARRYTPRISYPSKLCGREVPLEIVFKILFPLGGFLGELFDDGAYFIDSDGNFRKLVYLQHMSIYCAFIVHGLIDLAEFYKVPVIKGSNYMSMSLAFFWYGYSFYFHATLDTNKTPLENIVHVLPIPIMLFISFAGVAEFWLGKGHIWPQLVRTWGILSLGTWFTQAAFVLFTPATIGNPDWDQTDHRNIHAMTAALGAHLVLNLVIMMMIYTGIYLVMRLLGKTGERFSYEYKPVEDGETKKDSVALLDNEV